MKHYRNISAILIMVISLVFVASCSNSGGTGDNKSESEKAPRAQQQETTAQAAPEKKTVEEPKQPEEPPFANIILRDLDGKPARLSQLADGKPVYVAFFLSGGGPCMAQVPRINEIYEKYSGAGLAVFASSAQDPKEKILSARDKWQMKYPLRVYYLNDNSKYFRISAVPLNIVFDAKGRLVYKHRTPPPDTLLDMLLAK